MNHLERRHVCKRLRDAESDLERSAILKALRELPLAHPAFDRCVKVHVAVMRKHEWQAKRDRQEKKREVKVYLAAVREFRRQLDTAIAVAEFGKFTPEAARFLVGWHDGIRLQMHMLELALAVVHSQLESMQ